MKLALLLTSSKYRYCLHKATGEEEVHRLMGETGQVMIDNGKDQIILNIGSHAVSNGDSIITNESVSTVVNNLQNILISYLNWEGDLSQALSYKEPVKQALTVLKQRVINPVLIFDGSFKFLGYSRKPDADWIASIEKGYISFGVADVIALREKLSSDRNIQGQVLVIDGFRNRFYIQKIILRNDDCFFLIIDDQNPQALRNDIQLIAAVTDKISAAVGLHNFPYLTQNANLEGVLRDLLSRPEISHTELQNRLQFDPHELKRPLAILCISSKDRRNQIFGTILTKYVSFHYAQFDVYVIENYSPVIAKTIAQELIGYLKQHQLTAGLSNQFNKLHFFNRYYQQAVKAIEFHRPGEHFSQYSDHIAADLIAHIREDNSIQTYLDPAIMYLRSADTKLFSTLQAFLEEEENKKMAAARLHIHRSTLDYRLNKITREHGIDLGARGKYVYYLLTVLLSK